MINVYKYFSGHRYGGGKKGATGLHAQTKTVSLKPHKKHIILPVSQIICPAIHSLHTHTVILSYLLTYKRKSAANPYNVYFS